MTPMSDLVKRFHEDLQASLRAGVPFDLGNVKQGSDATRRAAAVVPSGPASESKLARLQQLIKERLTAGDSLESIIRFHTDLPDQYRAALHLVSVSGAADLAIEGLAGKSDSRRELARAIRMPLVYVILVLLLAAVLAHFFTISIAPSFASMRQDLQLVPIIDTPKRWDPIEWLGTLATLWALAATLLLLVVALGGTVNIARRLGGRRFEWDRLASRAIRSADLLARRGVPLEQAIAVGCQLLGDSKAGRHVREILNLEVPPDDGATEQSTPNPRLASGEDDSAAMPPSLTYLTALADQLELSADTRLDLLKALYPVAMVFAAGLSVVAIYALALFLPLTEMLNDLTNPPRF